MRQEVRSRRALAELANRQHGIVSSGQMHGIGYSASAIQRAFRAGRLHRVHRGVYAVGHERISAHGRCLAAVLACGRDAVLSHFAAAWLWGLSQNAPERIDVTVGSSGGRRRSIRVHHAPALAEGDTTVLQGIPVTALARTLLDLAAVAPRRLARAIERSERLEAFDLDEVESLLARCAGHRGASGLRRALTGYREPAFTRSGLERRFLELVQHAGLPRPATNHFICGHEIDMYWAPERFGVELDTYDFHGDRAAFERDRVRQEELKLAGIEIVRLTGSRVDREPGAVIDRVVALLTQRRCQLGSAAPPGAGQ